MGSSSRAEGTKGNARYDLFLPFLYVYYTHTRERDEGRKEGRGGWIGDWIHEGGLF